MKSDITEGTTSKEPQTNEQSSSSNIRSIQQLLSATSIVTSPSNLLAPTSQSAFINALVSMLQVSLAGRALRSQPDLAKAMDQAESIVAKTTTTSGGASTPSRVANEFGQLESRSELLKHVKTLLANHQQQKIQGAESRVQGQEGFYYVLPVSRDGESPPEILFRTEEQEQQNGKRQQSAGKIWHLTMKLDIGSLGELLAKTRIHGDDIQLNIYASTEPLLVKVFDTLPYLLRRLQSLGVNVEHHSCQRGKLQGSLKEAPYQLFEALV